MESHRLYKLATDSCASATISEFSVQLRKANGCQIHEAPPRSNSQHIEQRKIIVSRVSWPRPFFGNVALPASARMQK
jgi:hypothetical protein